MNASHGIGGSDAEPLRRALESLRADFGTGRAARSPLSQAKVPSLDTVKLAQVMERWQRAAEQLGRAVAAAVQRQVDAYARVSRHLGIEAGEVYGLPVFTTYRIKPGEVILLNRGRQVAIHPWYDLERGEYRPPYWTRYAAGVREAGIDEHVRKRCAPVRYRTQSNDPGGSVGPAPGGGRGA